MTVSDREGGDVQFVRELDDAYTDWLHSLEDAYADEINASWDAYRGEPLASLLVEQDGPKPAPDGIKARRSSSPPRMPPASDGHTRCGQIVACDTPHTYRTWRVECDDCEQYGPTRPDWASAHADLLDHRGY